MSKLILEKRFALKAMSYGWVSILLYGCKSPESVTVIERPVPSGDKTNIPLLSDVMDNRPIPSKAKNLRDYRLDAANHLYRINPHKIYTGKLPPLIYAVGVLRIDIAANGDLNSVDWMRKPVHAPEVIAEIERKIHMSSPFPAPIHLGRLTYTETWLWHKSGRFQLHTLTEGQN